MTGAREAALLALNDIFYNGKYSNLAVKETLKKCRDMEKHEKALFTNIVYGVVSRHYTLEYIIKKYSSIKIKKLARYVKLILEMGIYQLMYLDKIPESAAVNESVKLAKKYTKKGSERFINAVLRAFCRDGKTIEFSKSNLAIKHSFNPEMADMFTDMFGFEFADSLMDALNGLPDILLRPNAVKTTAEELSELLRKSGIENSVTDNEMIKTEGFDVAANNLYNDGYFTPQDKGAYTASIVLDPQKGETIIDMCAAPGGKTTHIAEIMSDTGTVLAFDKYEHKTQLIKSNANRLGLSSVTAKTVNSEELNKEYIKKADRVLCDVPCSGWGIIRRKPDIKLAHTDLDELYTIQKTILENGAEYVKSGGSVVYSTCTVNKHENEEQISEFLKTHEDFTKVYEKTFYPHIDGCDGFFICRMDRK